MNVNVIALIAVLFVFVGIYGSVLVRDVMDYRLKKIALEKKTRVLLSNDVVFDATQSVDSVSLENAAERCERMQKLADSLSLNTKTKHKK